jgi:hypothetical protein
LVHFVTYIVSTTTGAAALKASGITAVLLPLISAENNDPVQMKVIGKIFSVMELLLDSDETVVDLLRELNGVDALVNRIVLEVKKLEQLEAPKGKDEMTDSTPVQDEGTFFFFNLKFFFFFF